MAAPRPPGGNSAKLRVLFVGAFSKMREGATGGVVTASLGLIGSPISDHVDFIRIDSTARSVPPPPVFLRGLRAVPRVLRLVWYLFTTRIDVAYILASDGSSFVEKGAMALLAHVRGIPVVLNPVSGLIPDDLDRSRFFRWYVPFVMRRCERVMCQGSYWQDVYAEIVGDRGRTVVVYNWIDPETVPDRSSATLVAGNPIQVLYMGWVERLKGIFDLIDAAAMARDVLMGSVFVICGKGTDLDRARSYAVEKGVSDCFDFRGWVGGAEKDSLFARADIYVHPSHREGMPNALLEAMTAGIPPIAARTGAIPDLIRSSDTGVLFEPGDVRALARALGDLVASPERRTEMGEAARRHALAHHTIESIWPKILELFESASRRSRTTSGSGRSVGAKPG